MSDQESSKTPNIRDFLYLDVERIKSIFAQLEEGLVTGREQVEGTAKEISGEGRGGIPALLNLAAQGKFIWQNEERETKTLHDYMYHHVESKMRDGNMVVAIDDPTFSPEALRNGKLHSLLSENSFLLIRGKIQLDDYDYLKGILESFNKLAGFIAQCAGSQPSVQQTKVQGKRIEREARPKNALDDWLVKGLKNFFDTFYKERCMITIHPNESVPEIYFTGHLIKPFIRDGLESVIFRYGTSPDITWSIFAQIAYIPSGSESVQNDVFLPEAKLSQKVQSLDEALRAVFDALRGMEKIATGVFYPAISIIPIAIYR